MKHELIKRILSSIVLISIVIFIFIKGSYFFILFLTTCFFIILYEWNTMVKKNFYKVFGLIFLLLSFYSAYKLRINSLDSYAFIFFITTICVSTDIGGYIFGKLFKGPKLSKLSPNKTYSGMVGSFLLSAISMILFIIFLYEENVSINLLIFGVLISAVSQLGDLIISYFKRLSKVKDTGSIIPGHGGLLDRVDGMLFAFPFSYVILLTDIL